MQTSPCLCGDPACGRCFSGAQVRCKCLECGWEGRSYELSAQACPLCDGRVTDDLPHPFAADVLEDPRYCVVCGASETEHKV